MNNRNKDNQCIAGINSVLEALKSNQIIDTIYVTNKNKNHNINKIIALAKKNDIVVKDVNPQKLDKLSEGVNNQGVVAIAGVANYVSVEEILNKAKSLNQNPFIIIIDEIEDPHNLGAIIRTAEASGVHGIILSKRRCASLTTIVNRTSAGAVNHMLVSRVSNIANTIDSLKQNNIWIYGADMDGTTYSKINYDGAIGLIIGSEGKGISPLIKQKCDFIVSLPMEGKVNSLNASVAGGILMYEILKQKLN